MGAKKKKEAMGKIYEKSFFFSFLIVEWILSFVYEDS